MTSLTLEEKASLCSGSDFWNLKGIPGRVPPIMVTDGPHGLRKQTGAADHVGLNDSVPATCFPTACALGSSWDPDLLYAVGAAIGEEARQERVGIVLGPGVNIKRSPLCGRNFEYYSEDPFLSGVLGAAFVRGVQHHGVGTSVKHFVANNQETRRMTVNAVVDERALREIYLAGFDEVVRSGRPRSVMCAYNRLNGEYCSEHRTILTDILRDEWGFDGIVVTDWGAANDRLIVEAVREGRLPESVLDESVQRIIRAVLSSSDALASGFRYDVDTEETDPVLIDEAVRVASHADVAVVFAGLPDVSESEGFDRAHLEMPPSHDALIRKVAEANRNVVVVLSNGSSVRMPWIDDVRAVLETYLSGQAWGAAVAELLLGIANPCGKLAETFPLSLDDVPATPNFPGGTAAVAYGESVYVGYRYFASTKTPTRFPFGYGLSYTSFSYDDLEIATSGHEVTVSFSVTNAGSVAGKEVAQVYVRDVASTVFRPDRELKGFVKVSLEPGERVSATLTLDRRAFAFWDAGVHRWVVEAGEFELLVGASSDDIRLQGRFSCESDDTLSPWARALAANASGYFAPNHRVFSNLDSDGDFAHLLGRPVPAPDTDPSLPLTRTSSMTEIRRSLVGRLLYRSAVDNVARMTGEGGPTKTTLMMQAIIREMPLRNLGMMSSGRLTMVETDALLQMMNGRFVKGFFALGRFAVGRFALRRARKRARNAAAKEAR